MSSIPYSRYIVYPITWYSFLIVLGASLAIVLASRQERHAGLKKDTVIDLSLWLLPFGIIGARIYYVIFAWNDFRNDFFSVFRIWEGGIAIYGAIIAGMIVLFVFCRIRKLPVLLLCDMIAPGLALAQSIGRWGNFFNMEAYGVEIQNQALRFFPLGVEIPAGSGNSWHLVTFFFESVLDFSIFVFLLVGQNRFLKKRGDVFFFYLFLYAAGRLVIEELRTDSLYASSTVRISQLISICLCFAILIRYLYVSFRERSLPSFLIFGFSFISMLLTVFILLCSVTRPAFFSRALSSRVIFLTGYSFLMILILFLTFFLPKRAEVVYADDKI